MILNIVLLVLGFVLLIKGADMLIDGSSSLALNLKIPKILIGLTIVAFGTSAPELAVSINARISGSDDIVIGNVLGSSIFNTLLIIGIAALIKSIKVNIDTIKKELPLQLILSILLVVLMLDINLDGTLTNLITRSDALAITLFFAIFIYYLISVSHKKAIFKERAPFKIPKSIAFAMLGLVSLIYGSNLVVDNATNIAKIIGVSDRIIALTIVAFGTSLPELITSIESIRKGEDELLLGNIIGSNIFNICIVLAIPIAIFGTIEASDFSLIDIVAFIIAALVLFIVAKTKNEISKKEGILMILLFIIYYSLIFII